MQKIARLVSTCFGIGYLPIAPGTWASAFALLIAPLFKTLSTAFGISALLAISAIAVAASSITERDCGIHDPSFIVIDELAGMIWILFFIPKGFGIPWMVAAFFLFRIFDILKPFPLKWLAKAPRGWGIVLDDLGASLYSFFLLALAARFF
jgi:phosphatidylglycerophosphatase A